MNDEIARELLGALREMTRALRLPSQVTTRSGDRGSNFFKPFSNLTTITGTTGFDAWTPTAGKRFVLRGGVVCAVVHTVLAATPGVRLDLIDSNSSATVCPIGGASPTAAAGTVIYSGPIDLAEGVRGSIIDAKITVKQSLTIGSGVISVSGILWGEESDT